MNMRNKDSDHVYNSCLIQTMMQIPKYAQESFIQLNMFELILGKNNKRIDFYFFFTQQKKLFSIRAHYILGTKNKLRI